MELQIDPAKIGDMLCEHVTGVMAEKARNYLMDDVEKGMSQLKGDAYHLIRAALSLLNDGIPSIVAKKHLQDIEGGYFCWIEDVEEGIDAALKDERISSFLSGREVVPAIMEAFEEAKHMLFELQGT